MKYVGIDLGTTNSAICSYDGELVWLYKSPEQHDVTPSAILFDKRGNKFIGSRAYDNAPGNPKAAATLFKRFMGTGTPVNLPAVNRTMTPEECSAEILKVVFGLLPEDIRKDSDTGTVITVPAAFNQMKKDATMSSAEMAGIGRVALMQEPVAAVMSVMHRRKSDGIFLIYDLGGGTLDIALAESISGNVSLLSHDGIEMCGGRDFDLALVNNIVVPWLLDHFDLPSELSKDPVYETLWRMAVWATEKAKIELSGRDEAVVGLSDMELRARDLSGNEIYLEVGIDRARYDELIASKVDDSIQVAREAMKIAGLGPQDIERIVFIGGPTFYKPLRDKVALELGIAPSTEVNPMIAVAEGAAIFAESIDWASRSRGRKSSRGALCTGGTIDISFDYIARTPGTRARVVPKFGRRNFSGSGFEFQIDSLDTGWSSGRVSLKDGAAVELSLPKPGENTFKVFVFDENGSPVTLDQDRIVISRTAATIDAIPASHSISMEAREKIGGRIGLDFLVRRGDQLPKKGKKIFKAEESLWSGKTGSIKFKLWEGEIEDPIEYNRFIGIFEIKGSDFNDGVIAAGSDLICDYEVLDSGNIRLDVTIPSIGGAFHSRNMYSRQEGQIDYTKASKLIAEQLLEAMKRLGEMASKIDDPQLEKAREKLEQAESIKAGESDPETAKQAMDGIDEARRLLALARKEHLREIRQLEFDKTVEFFSEYVRQYARQSELSTIDNLVKTAQRSIDNNSGDFEYLLGEVRSRNFWILWRQDWFVIERFKWFSEDSHLFGDAEKHRELISIGMKVLKADNVDELRNVVIQLERIRIHSGGGDEMFARGNLLRSY
jgi:molecular chaperone DnaK